MGCLDPPSAWAVGNALVGGTGVRKVSGFKFYVSREETVTQKNRTLIQGE
jgi:hypothetical protein